MNEMYVILERGRIFTSEGDYLTDNFLEVEEWAIQLAIEVYDNPTLHKFIIAKISN